jgi:hypothetical protein
MPIWLSHHSVALKSHWAGEHANARHNYIQAMVIFIASQVQFPCPMSFRALVTIYSQAGLSITNEDHGAGVWVWVAKERSKKVLEA